MSARPAFRADFVASADLRRYPAENRRLFETEKNRNFS